MIDMKKAIAFAAVVLGMSLATACSHDQNVGNNDDQRNMMSPSEPQINKEMTDTTSSMRNSPNRSNSPRDTAKTRPMRNDSTSR